MTSRRLNWIMAAVAFLADPLPCTAQENLLWEVKYPVETNTVFGGANALTRDSSGNFITAGTVNNGSTNDIIVAKYSLSSGALDTTFGSGGMRIYDGGVNEEGIAVAVGLDGAIYVAGNRTGATDDIVVLKLTSSGALDFSFGDNGVRLYDSGRADRAGGVAVSGSTSASFALYIVGTTNNGVDNDLLLLKYSISGSLDRSFSDDGVQTYNGGGDDRGNGIALDSADKVHVTGQRGGDLLLLKYDSSGALDANLGNGGVVTYDNGRTERGQTITFDSSGRICIAGTTDGFSATDDILVLRYTATGLLDPTFGGGGFKIYDAGGNERANAIAVHEAGNVYVAATSVDPIAPNDTDIVILKYTPWGVPDADFDGDGIQTIAGADNESAGGIAVDAGGNVFLAGGTEISSRGYQFILLVKFENTGLLNRTYSGAGFANGVATAVDSLGNIYVAGDLWNGTDADFLLLRYTPAGVLDTAFSDDGVAIWNSGREDRAAAVAIDANGYIVIAGTSGSVGTSSDIAVVKFTSSGILDTSFSGDGAQVYDNGNDDRAGGVAVDGDGNIIVTGGSRGNLIVLKYTAAGAPHPSFGVGGVQTYDGGAADDAGAAATTDGSRNIHIVGTSNANVLLLRYTPTGVLDASFGAGGVVVYDGGGADGGNGVTLDRNGNIYVVGRRSNGANDDLLLLKYTSSGSPDTTFSGDGLTVFDGGAGESESFSGIVVDKIGTVVTVGGSNGTVTAKSGNVLILKYSPDGTRVAAFGDNGVVSLDSGSVGNDLGRGVATGGSFYGAGTWAGRKVWLLKYVGAPNAPSNLAATAISSSRITLSWTDNSNDEEGFKIERSYNGTEWNEVGGVTKDVTTYTSVDLTPSWLVYHRVRSSNAYGDSKTSNEAADTTLPGDGGGGGGGSCFISESNDTPGAVLPVLLAVVALTIIARLLRCARLIRR